MLSLFLIFLSFAFIHSITTATMFKRACEKLAGRIFMQAFYRSLYTVVSFATAAAAFLFISRLPDRELWTAPAWAAWLMQGIRGGAVVAALSAFKHLDGWEFLGIKQVWRYATRRETSGDIDGLTQQGLVTTGVYGFVRHPLYLAGIIFFTLDPRITMNGLAVTILADAYFLFGMLIEERRFLKIFGEEYALYMKRVPRMLPSISAVMHSMKKFFTPRT